MPVYPYACECGHKFDRLLAITENVSEQQCPGCGKIAKQDYAAKMPQIGPIDGPTSGYYGKAFPKDPNNPAKSIVPSKHAWNEYCKRKEVEDIA